MTRKTHKFIADSPLLKALAALFPEKGFNAVDPINPIDIVNHVHDVIEATFSCLKEQQRLTNTNPTPMENYDLVQKAYVQVLGPIFGRHEAETNLPHDLVFGALEAVDPLGLQVLIAAAQE